MPSAWRNAQKTRPRPRPRRSRPDQGGRRQAARKIAEQQERDAAEARRIERDGKIALTNKQIELMDAKRADEMAKHAQDMNKGALELSCSTRRSSSRGVDRQFHQNRRGRGRGQVPNRRSRSNGWKR
jgi:hypothetical protein